MKFLQILFNQLSTSILFKQSYSIVNIVLAIRIIKIDIRSFHISWLELNMEFIIQYSISSH